MSSRCALKLFVRLAPAALAGALAMTTFAPSSNAAVLPQPYVALHGEGAWSVAQELVPWQNELASASSFVDLNYSARGSFFGRQDLASGVADFAISGRPFAASELTGVKGGAASFIDAPVQVATIATFVEPPAGGFNSEDVICDPDDPTTWPPGVTDGSVGCVVRAPITAPLRIPNRNLVAMYLEYPGTISPALNQWNNADIVSAMHVQQFDLGYPFAYPDVAGRSDPDEINYYLQEFEKTAAPDVWHDNQALYPDATWEPTSEHMPQVVGVTRDGAEQQVDQLAQGGYGVGRGATSQFVQGGIAAAPPSTLRSFQSTFRQAPLVEAQMQNANGDWVAPTPTAIDKAVAAGGDTPLFALTNKVAGAYPLVWVDHLYAPAHGLSIEKTEGLATMIRYLVTTGQDKAGPVGEGRLSPALVAKALQAADALVRSNCQGADRQVVVSSDPGPLAPATATAMRSIGAMAHCAPAAPATSTSTTPTMSAPASSTPTTAAPVAPSAVPAGGSPSLGSGAPLGSGATGAGRTATGGSDTATADGGETIPITRNALTGLLTASKLPLPAPGATSGGDRLATFLLGAALYLFARKPVARVARRVAP